jgi:hypothetical protein
MLGRMKATTSPEKYAEMVAGLERLAQPGTGLGGADEGLAMNFAAGAGLCAIM